MKLRDYQARGLQDIRNHLKQGKKRILYVAATGSGKGVVISEIIRSAYEKRNPCLFVVDNRDIVDQIHKHLTGMGLPTGIVMAGHPNPSELEHVYVGTVQSVLARKKKGSFDPEKLKILIIDESHSMRTDGMYDKLLEHYPEAIVVGFTATPYRMDGQGLGVFFEEMVQPITYSELVNQKYLVPFKYFIPWIPKMEGIKTSDGDYSQRDLDDLVEYNQTRLVADVVHTYATKARGKPAICFAVNIKHSLSLRDGFLACGINAVHIDGKTPKDEREEILERMRNGEIEVLCNVGVLTKGTDIPRVSAIIMARPTKSIPLHIQMLGRGARLFEGKECCEVYDHAGNVARLGPVSDYDTWTLSKKKGELKPKDDDPTKLKTKKDITCDECGHVFQGTRVCPQCGALKEWETIPREIVEEEGELREMDHQSAKKEHKDWSVEEKLEWYAQLLYHARVRGYKDGWASNQYRDKFGVWPARTHGIEPEPPSPEVLSWVRSRQIRYAKGKEKQAQRQAQHDFGYNVN